MPNFPKKQTFLRGKEMFVFSENLACFVFLKHPYWDSPFYLITDELFDESNSSDRTSFFIFWYLQPFQPVIKYDNMEFVT